MKKLMAEAKFYADYSRCVDGKYETWEEAVTRVMDMHRDKYSDKMSTELDNLILEADSAYKDKLVLGAQRALQFGGEQLRKEEIRMYNCSSSYADRVKFFGEALYMMLCGAGIGFSVQHHHVEKLPSIARPTKGPKVFVVPDSIEGWADALDVQMSAYFGVGEYGGHHVIFNLSAIRPKGAFISGGFKAPGPEPLAKALQNICSLLDWLTAHKGSTYLRPIDVYDVVMHAADAVIAGGVRRSACICMFSPEDVEMADAKTGEWFIDNPQRGRSNNSVMLVRGEVTREEFTGLMAKVRGFGEPGVLLVDSSEFTLNPCAEISMLPVSPSGESGWQFCCLVEINGGRCDTEAEFLKACSSAAILCTLQAGYTDFGYVTPATREITEREALIGVSITGWMENPDILFDEKVLGKGVEVVKSLNAKVAGLIGINVAARCTTVKPSGNASVLLGTSSGIHGDHSRRYLRHVQMNKESEVSKLIQEVNPSMVEESVWSANGTDIVVGFPISSPDRAILKQDLLGVKQLEYVKKAQEYWVSAGTNVELCTDPRLRHNVSNTITVDDWEEVEQYVWDNLHAFTGISFLAMSGDRDYVQAPFAEVHAPEQLVGKYGAAAVFASGLIVDGLHAFNNDLWSGIATAISYTKGERTLPETAANVLKRDWVRRFVNFSDTYFNSEYTRGEYCLKDVFYLHKYTGIRNKCKDIDWASELGEKAFVDIDSTGAQGCAGGACEVSF